MLLPRTSTSLAAAAGGSRDPRDRHRFGAAGDLPQELVAAAQGIRRLRSRFGRERLFELDAIDHAVGQAFPNADVELVKVAVACAQALVTLAGLVQRVEVHDQVELAVVCRASPRHMCRCCRRTVR